MKANVVKTEVVIPPGRLYVPALKWKRGEASALKDLTKDVAGACTPVIEIAPVPYDFKKGADRKSVRQHLEDSAEMLKGSWGAALAFIDPRHLGPKLVTGKTVTLAMDLVRAEGSMGVVTISTSSSPDVLAAAAGVAKVDGRGVCLRERINDVMSSSYVGQVNAALLALGVPASQVDYILDLQDVAQTNVAIMSTAVPGLIAKIPHLAKWRSFTLLSTAFPINLSGVPKGEHRLARADWMLWNSLGAIARQPTYGDYAVSHWDIQELDPRVIKISASIRYTIDDAWLILRGRNVKDHGFKQFSAFSKQLVKNSVYPGPEFCAGDAHIAKCAAGGPTGNHETWRRVATNRHITFVVRQIATKLASSALGAPGGAVPSP